MKKKYLIGFCCFAAMALSVSAGASAADRYQGDQSAVDATQADNGYVTAAYTGGGSQRIKVIIEKDGAKYSYDLNNQGQAEKFPLQMGNGSYSVRVMKNTSGNKYAAVQTVNFNVSLTSQFAPYLTSSQFVNYTSGSTTVKKAAELAAGAADQLGKVDAIYNYVTNNITYDTQKASSVQAGYLPNVDNVLATGKGICFDYSAVMAAMLRSQNIPTKMVTGYVSPNGAYHAWNEVYIDGVGWIKTGEVYFDGKDWKLLDPTFLSSGKSSNSIVKYIGNGSNYTVKYVY